MRMFSNDGKSIGSYVFRHTLYVKNSSIKGINHKKYFYGECGTNENVLQMLEAKWSPILKNIVDTHKVPRDEENYIYLLMFLLVSSMRTPYISKDFEKSMIDLVGVIYELYATHGHTEYEGKNPEVTFKGIPSMFLKSAIGMAPILLDLYPTLIINKTKDDFVTSDYPVALYNQLFILKNIKAPCGLGLCGLQMFLPLSPRICLCVYDNAIYKAKTNSSNNVVVSSRKTINEINKLLVLNSDTRIMFNNNADKVMIERLALYKNSTNIAKSGIIELPDSSKAVNMFVPKTVYDTIHMCFFSIKRKARKLSFPHTIVRPGAGDFMVERHGADDLSLTKYGTVYFTLPLNVWHIPV